MYGSFVTTAGNPGGVIVKGPAHFPGHPPAGPGSCDNGLWVNAQGKRTAGSLDMPHPHCFQPSEGIQVVLEPISVCHTGLPKCALESMLGLDPAGQKTTGVFLVDHRSSITRLTGTTIFAKDGVTPVGGSTTGFAEWIVGYAIDAATIAGTPRRVGWMVIDLSQFGSKEANYLDATCTLDDGLDAPCINLVISADYKPFPPEEGGAGSPGTANGFLWFTPATSPYNYQ